MPKKKKRKKAAQKRSKATLPYLAEFRVPAEYEHLYKDFRNGDHVLFFGEIANMGGHCAVALKGGRVLFGYHTETFRKLTEDELTLKFEV